MIYVDCTKRGAYADLLRAYSIRAYPTLIFADSDGEIVEALVGGAPARQLVAKFEENSGS